MQETQVQSPGQKDSLEKEMAARSSILAWEIPWTEQPGRLQSTGSQRVGHDLATKQKQQYISISYNLVHSKTSETVYQYLPKLDQKEKNHDTEMIYTLRKCIFAILLFILIILSISQCIYFVCLIWGEENHFIFINLQFTSKQFM